MQSFTVPKGAEILVRWKDLEGDKEAVINTTTHPELAAAVLTWGNQVWGRIYLLSPPINGTQPELILWSDGNPEARQIARDAVAMSPEELRQEREEILAKYPFLEP